MKKKSFLTVILVLVLCFSTTFAASATQSTAKNLVLTKVKNFELGYDKGFYENSEGTAQFNIKKFNGTIKDELGDYTGAGLKFVSQLDSASNSMKISYNTNIQGNETVGDIFIKDDKLIFTKDLLSLLQSFGVDMEKEMPGFMQNAPQYLYVNDQQINGVWEQMLSYQNQQIPEEYQQLLLFLVEAVPDKYFSISSNKITLELNQAAFEDVLFNLLTKVQNETERFADIVVTMNKGNYENIGISPEEMREQLISGITNNPMPSKEDIHLMSNFVDVNLSYESAILSGGLKKFNISVKFNAPDGSANGVLNVKTESKGKSGNINGKYDITGNYVAVDGPTVDVQIASDYKYIGTEADSDSTINVKVEDNTTGKLYCDISAVGESTSSVKEDIIIEVPELTANNSLNVLDIMPANNQFQQKVQKQQKQHVNLIVNGKYVETDIQPYIKDGKRTMVPVKFVSEALDCEVQWLEPNEVRITNTDGKVISMYIGESTYSVNGVKKQLDVNPYIENDMRTMVPVRFIAEELGATVELNGSNVVITK